tara:strand:+ start:311 stop:496 length:186 start_codon:yes stop_codon:yes gene_type:complete
MDFIPIIFFFVWGGVSVWITGHVFDGLDRNGTYYNGYMWFAFLCFIFFIGMFAMVGLVYQP